MSPAGMPSDAPSAPAHGKAPFWRGWLQRLVRGRATTRVVLAATHWTVNGVNVFSANLARELVAAGIDAEVLLTEQDTVLARYRERAMPRPPGVRFTTLPVPRHAGWGAHWAAMVRYLDEAGPCVFIPNSDWRHSCVCPQLPAHVAVVGVVHSDDPLHYDHVRRLGRYWDAVVAVSQTVAQRTLALSPELAPRLVTIPIGVRVPRRPGARPGGAGCLRVIYHGILKQHQKRVLDLPRIVAAAAAQGVPLKLTIAGGGPDEEALRAAAAPWVEREMVEFLGVVSPDDIARLLAVHDAYLLCSAFEGMPNALLEAMGHGCVPVVSDIDSGVRQLLRPGHNGHVVPIGDCEGFAAALGRLWQDPRRRRRMARNAHHSVRHGGFRVGDMAAAYRRVFARVAAQRREGAWQRPPGPLAHPPAAVAGVSLFPVPLRHEVEGLGWFPSEDDAEDYAQLLRLGSAAGVAWPRARPPQPPPYAGRPVFIAAPSWTANGVNLWSADMVRLLRAAGVDARLLLTEEDSPLVSVSAPRLPWPQDVPVVRLALRGPDSWGARWGALRRLLEEAAPCVYLPNYDWRHACIVPTLSDGVVVVGALHDEGPLYREQVERLADAWNAVLVPTRAELRRWKRLHPRLASRLHLLPRSLELPRGAPQRHADGAAVRGLVVFAGEESPDQQAWLATLARALRARCPDVGLTVVGAPPALAAALAQPGLSLAGDVGEDAWPAACAAHRFVIMGSLQGRAWPMVLEAMAQGCVPVLPGPAPQDHGVPDRDSAHFCPQDAAGAAASVQGLLQRPERLLAMAARAHAQSLETGLGKEQVRDLLVSIIDCCFSDVRAGRFARSPGPLRPPPAQVAGTSLFPVELPHVHPRLGPFISAQEADAFERESASDAAAPDASPCS